MTLADRVEAAFAWCNLEDNSPLSDLISAGHQYCANYGGTPTYKNPALTFVVGDYTHEFPAGSEPRIEEWCSRVEALRKEARYDRVCRSRVIDAAIEDWSSKGRRDKVKQVADTAVTKVDMGSFIAGMRTLAGLTDVPRVFVAQAAQTVVVFRADTEEEVVARFSDFAAKRSAQTPRKVMAKMVAGRMRKILEQVDDHNKRAMEKRLDGSPMYGRIKSQIPVPDLPTKGALNSFVSAHDDDIICGWGWEKVRQDAMQLLLREDVPDDVYPEAWDLIVVEGVIRS